MYVCLCVRVCVRACVRVCGGWVGGGGGDLILNSGSDLLCANAVSSV